MPDWQHRTAELDRHQAALVSQLAQIRELRRSCSLPPGWRYFGREDFLLQHGRWFAPLPWSHPGKEGRLKECYKHSLLLSSSYEGLHYVEGSALAPGLPIVLDHAWAADLEGSLVDGVWLNKGQAYLGVYFPSRWAWHANRCGQSVLDCRTLRTALYARPWREPAMQQALPLTPSPCL